MKSKQLLAGTLLATVLLLGSCQPNDSDLSVTVSKKVQPAAPNVTSDVSSGVVTLTGTVNDEATRQAAEDAARSISGVKSVVNHITVSPAAPAPAGPSTVLQQGLTTVALNYPEVTAIVNDRNEIVVTGQITPARWTHLKASLDSLRPVLVNSDSLVIK